MEAVWRDGGDGMKSIQPQPTPRRLHARAPNWLHGTLGISTYKSRSREVSPENLLIGKLHPKVTVKVRGGLSNLPGTSTVSDL